MAKKKSTNTKKKTATKNEVKVSVKKKSATKKAPTSSTKRRRSATAKKKVRRRTTEPKKEVKRERKNEFVIPIHTVEVSEGDKKDVIAKDELQKKIEEEQVRAQGDVYPIEKSKRVADLQKKNENITPKDESDQMNLNRIQGRKKKKNKNAKLALIIFGVLLGIIALASAGYAIWKTQAPLAKNESDLLAITGNKEIVVGTTQNISLTIKNTQDVVLDDVQVDAVFPGGFNVLDTAPVAQNDQRNKWSIDSLAPGESFSILISGKFIEAPKTVQTIKTRLSYKPINGSARFTEEDEEQFALIAPKVSIKTNAPDSISSDSGFDLVVQASNGDKESLENVELRIVTPDGYQLADTSPKTKKDGDTLMYSIDNLPSNQSDEVTISGSLTGDRDDVKQFFVQIGFISDQGKFYAQVEKELSVSIAEAVVKVTTLIYGDEQNAMSLGETLEYTVNYANEGTQSLKDAVIETQIDDTFVDTSTLEIEGGEYNGSAVVWNKETKEELANIDPETSGELKFKVTLKDEITIRDKDDVNFSHIAQSTLKAQVGEGPEEIESKGNQAVTKINSSYEASVEAHYYDFEGVQVGNGPHPPEAGKETVYRIYLVVSNETNELSDAVISLTLNDNVTFTSKSSTNVGSIKATGKTAVWSIGNVPTHTGRFENNIEAYVEVRYTPSSDDIGNTPDLTKLVEFSATDTFTDQELEKELPNTTTRLSGDAYVSEEGVVSSGANQDTESTDDVQININP